MKKLAIVVTTLGFFHTACAIESMGDLADGLEEGYSSEREYSRHCKVNERFFRRLSKNPRVREIIEHFRGKIAAGEDVSRINLDGFSSRTRVLLFRELTAAAKGVDRTIPFSLHGKEFSLALKTTRRQPGYGIISEIIESGHGTCLDIHNVLDIYKEEYQREVAKKLLSSRKLAPIGGAGHEIFGLDYHPPITNPILKKEEMSLHLELLNLLLDFEVARRFQGRHSDEYESLFKEEIEAHALLKERHSLFLTDISAAEEANREKAVADAASPKKLSYMITDKSALDRVPVASAIIGALNLASADVIRKPLQEFFHAPHADSGGYKWGKYSAFEGAPSSNKRGIATRKIIKELRGLGIETPTHKTLEETHQEYLEVFGGASESDGDPYLDSDSD